MKHRFALALSIIGLLLVASGASSAAVGAASVRGSHAPARTRGQNCLASAMPAGDTSPPPMTCYNTFAAAIAAATGGRVHLPASATPRSVSIRQLNAGAAPGDVFVLSIDYKNANFVSPTLTWTQSAQCGNFQSATMPTGWNDVVSSVATYSGCANTQYKNVDFGGTTFSISRNSQVSSMGSFNDSTSSEKWCTAKPC